jgi:Brp/Blh family beta-carotene 15,15'-monooxygenase
VFDQPQGRFYNIGMNKILLVGGILLVFFHHRVVEIPYSVQVIFLVLGVVLLGIPHGAVDLLVARQEAASAHKKFSSLVFLCRYLFQILVFGVLLYFFPLPALTLFVLMAAYHFGETDLAHVHTENWWGKLLVFVYGLLILSAILIHHIEEAVPIFSLIMEPSEYRPVVEFLKINDQRLLSVLFIAFFGAVFLFYNMQPEQDRPSGTFILRLAVLLVILYQLPLLLSFTFYFVLWHSSLSLSNIFRFLKERGGLPKREIWKNMFLFSLMAWTGTALFATFAETEEHQYRWLWFAFAALAVLTAPHLQIMHSMYHRLRKPKWEQPAS